MPVPLLHARQRRNVLLVTLLLLVGASAFMTCTHEPPVPPIVPEEPPVIASATCDPDTVYFQQTILPLLVSQCGRSGCHDAITHAEGLSLVSYGSIMASGLVVPGSPSSSKLVEVISANGAEDVMPPPPSAPLSAAQIAAISTWIHQGAPNNACIGACDTSNVTYTGTIAPLFALKCNGCHGGTAPSGGIALTSYPGVHAVAVDGRLAGSVQHLAGYTAMPPAGAALQQCEVDEIVIWINSGAPND